MIYQIESIKTKTETLPSINKALLQARHIQARLHNKQDQPTRTPSVWSPTTTGPFIVPVSRWIE